MISNVALKRTEPLPSDVCTVPHERSKRSPLIRALQAWRKVLGYGAVSPESVCSGRYGANLLGVERNIPAAVVPRNTEQVQAVVRIAARYRIPLYPVSTGKNWGYGSACPVQNDCVIVDLSRMKAIVDLDEQAGTVTLEPGVTQGMLANELDRRGMNLMVPVTGAGPDASILGNALERGYGITPHADHFAAVQRLEAVLPNGECYRSALSEAGAEAVDGIFKWGVGPYLDGLFAQGNMGIVTRVTIALAPRPERVEAFFAPLRSDDDLEGAVTAIRSILRDLPGVVGSINLMNARRVLSMAEPYPFDRVGPCAILPDEVVEQLSRKNQITPWLAAGTIYGCNAVVAAARKHIARVLKPYCRHRVFVTPERATFLAKWSSRLPMVRGSKMANLAERLNAALRNMAGRPSDIALPLVYWKSRVKLDPDRPFDPARDGRGLAWYAPLVPMESGQVRDYVEMIEKHCRRHGMEPLITLTSVSERCFDSTVPLLFDLNHAEEKARAEACYDSLFEAGRKRGFVPYRLGISKMKKLVRPDTPFWRMAAAIKRSVDPDNIIAPGRYA